MIVLTSDESDEDGELPLESNTVTNANLKIVYDVEYRAPVLKKQIVNANDPKLI